MPSGAKRDASSHARDVATYSLLNFELCCSLGPAEVIAPLVSVRIMDAPLSEHAICKPRGGDPLGNNGNNNRIPHKGRLAQASSSVSCKRTW